MGISAQEVKDHIKVGADKIKLKVDEAARKADEKKNERESTR